MSQDFFASCDYLSDYTYPLIINDRLIEYINKVKQQFDEEDELFKGKDLFRLIGLMTGADGKTLASAMRNKKGLKEGGMLDILYKLIPKMFVAGCVWEKCGQETNEMIHNDSVLRLSKVRRHLDNHHKRMKKMEDEIEGKGMISESEHESDIKSIRQGYKEQIEDLRREIRKLKGRIEINQSKHDMDIFHHKQRIKIQEEVINMPSQEEQKTEPNKAPDKIPNEESSS